MGAVVRRNRHGYTVVQHAAYVEGHNPQFARGLQSTPITDEAQRASVLRIGGMVFDKYQHAEQWAEREAYPAEYFGTIPIAQGSFADEYVNGLPIYIAAG